MGRRQGSDWFVEVPHAGVSVVRGERALGIGRRVHGHRVHAGVGEAHREETEKGAVPEAEGGEFAPFYNVPALTMTLVHGLVTRTKCNVIMGYGRRIPSGFDVVFKEPDPEIYHDDVQVSLAALNRSVENCINDCPEQYQWEYKRFKRQPSRKNKPYDQH